MTEIKRECRNCQFYVIGAGGPWKGLCKKCGAHQTHGHEACGQYRQAHPELVASNAEFEKRHAEEIQKIDDFVKGRVVRTNLESVLGLGPAKRSTEDFNELCRRSGLKKKVLAEICGKHPATFSRYAAGKTPIPEAIWRLVEIEAAKRA